MPRAALASLRSSLSLLASNTGSWRSSEDSNDMRSLADVSDDAELNKLVEAEKKKFKGRELIGKTLGVVGLGVG